MYTDPLGLKYIPLRETIENLGGTVEWNSRYRAAVVSLDGQIAYAKNQDKQGNYIGYDGKMYSDDNWLFSALAISFDLGNGWTGRIERNLSGGRRDRHVHISKGKVSYAQNEDGSPHDGSMGSPPNKQKKNLSSQKGWDWDAKEKNWLNKIDIAHTDTGNVIITYPDGKTVTIILNGQMLIPVSNKELLKKCYIGSTIMDRKDLANVPVVPITDFAPGLIPAQVPIPAPIF